MFDFYLKILQNGFDRFCGVEVNIDFDVNGSEESMLSESMITGDLN
jgi:hypothetical protein